MNYEEYEKEALRAANAGRLKEQMRNNERVNERKIKEVKKGKNIALVSIGLLTAGALFFAVSYSQTKAKLKETIIDPRTGFTTDNGKNPTSKEVFDEMFNRGH